MYGPVFNYTPGSTYGAGQNTEGTASPFSKPFVTGGSQDSLDLSGQHGEHKKSEGFVGAVKDFGKGIVKGAINTVTGLFTLKGMAMALGTLALVAVAPAVAIPLLVAGGVTMGGIQVAKGVSTGNWEQAGEGTFTLAATMLGAKAGPKSFKGSGGEKYAFVKTATKDGVTTVSKPTGFWGKTVANLKATFGGKLAKVDKDGSITITPEGKIAEGKTIYQLGKDSVSARFGSKKADSAGAASTGTTTTTAADTATTADTATDAAKTESVKPQTAKERLLARKQQEELKNNTGRVWQLDEQGNLYSTESSSNKVLHSDERGIAHTTKAMEHKRFTDTVSKVRKEVNAATAEAVDKEQGFFGSLMTTPEKEAAVSANAKSAVIQKHKAELDGLLGGLNPSEKAKFIELIDATTPEGKAEFSALSSKVKAGYVEQQKLHQAATQADTGAGKLNPEVAKLKQLQQAGDLNEADAALLKTLEEKYPHRSSANVLKRQELNELKALHTAQTEGTITEAQSTRLSELKKQFPDEGSQLMNTRYIDMIQKMRQDGDLSNMPKPIQDRWAPELASGKEHFQRELDYAEFGSLKELRGNKTFEFTDKHLNRYKELESTLKERLQTIEDQTNPDIFSNPGILTQDNKALEAEMTRVTDLLKAQETVNPSLQDLKSLRAMDREIYQSNLKLGIKPEASATVETNGAASGASNGEAVVAETATDEANAANTQDKAKKWYSGFSSGPHGSGQILASTITGATMNE